jgi:uncharacterized membrane protein YkoI
MKFSGCLFVGGVLMAAVIPVAGDESPGCLSQEQRRAAIATHHALPLGRAVRAAKVHLGGEIVRARLCGASKGLVYELTMLAHDGKVTRATLDALSGAYLGGR